MADVADDIDNQNHRPILIPILRF